MRRRSRVYACAVHTATEPRKLWISLRFAEKPRAKSVRKSLSLVAATHGFFSRCIFGRGEEKQLLRDKLVWEIRNLLQPGLGLAHPSAFVKVVLGNRVALAVSV